jgi:hemophore-related protein
MPVFWPDTARLRRMTWGKLGDFLERADAWPANRRIGDDTARIRAYDLGTYWNQGQSGALKKWKAPFMVNSFCKKLAATVGVAATCLAAGTGIASADPLVDTTCTFPQVIAALNVQNPDLAQKINGNGLAKSMLTNFLNQPPAQRANTIADFQKTSWGQKYFVPLAAVAGTCNNF